MRRGVHRPAVVRDRQPNRVQADRFVSVADERPAHRSPVAEIPSDVDDAAIEIDRPGCIEDDLLSDAWCVGGKAEVGERRRVDDVNGPGGLADESAVVDDEKTYRVLSRSLIGVFGRGRANRLILVGVTEVPVVLDDCAVVGRTRRIEVHGQGGTTPKRHRVDGGCRRKRRRIAEGRTSAGQQNKA